MSTQNFDVKSIKECADILVQSVIQICKDNNISESQDISIYVIDTPIVHSTILGKIPQRYKTGHENCHAVVLANPRCLRKWCKFASVV